MKILIVNNIVLGTSTNYEAIPLFLEMQKAVKNDSVA